jgi:hypothetical protein
MEAVMSRLMLSAALLTALLSPTASLAAPRAAHIHHHPHAHIVGPGIVGPNWDLYGSDGAGSAPVYGGSYGAPGAFYGRESGGVNSMSNDFGTSGVLGHTNGMPAISP